MAMGVPGTDMRSIPMETPIPALRDMSSVEAAGGQSSDVQLEEGMGLEALIEEFTPKVVEEILMAIKADPAKLDAVLGEPQPQAPQGALMGIEE